MSDFTSGFWSLTMYDPQHFFYAHDLNRYSLGTKNSKTLKYDPDGGLTLYLGNKSPGKDKEGNWLPSPSSGSFLVIMRTYMPGPEIVEQKWTPPSVVETAR